MAMPYRKIRNADGTYRVIGPSGIHARSTTSKKADAQIRIMMAADEERLDWDTPKHKSDRALRRRGYR